MAKKPARKPLPKKAMKRTKGGLLIGLIQPSLKPPVLKPVPLLPPGPTSYPPNPCN